MHVTTKGQVTIPVEVREKLGIFPNSEVQFELLEGAALLRKMDTKDSRGEKLIRRLKGRGDIQMSTDEIMALSRGDA